MGKYFEKAKGYISDHKNASIIVLAVLIVVGGIFIYNKHNSINGSWQTKGVTLDVKGNKAFIAGDTEVIKGDVDKSAKVIVFHDSKGYLQDFWPDTNKKYPDLKVKYELVNKKLFIESKDFSATFKRVTKTTTKSKSKTASASSKTIVASSKESSEEFSSEESSSEESSGTDYNNSDELKSLDPGEYEVGSDIKPGPYKVEMYYRDDDYAPAEGSGTVQIGNRTFKFNADEHGLTDSKRIILHEGDTVTLSSDSDKSDFSFAGDSDGDY